MIKRKCDFGEMNFCRIRLTYAQPPLMGNTKPQSFIIITMIHLTELSKLFALKKSFSFKFSFKNVGISSAYKCKINKYLFNKIKC